MRGNADLENGYGLLVKVMVVGLYGKVQYLYAFLSWNIRQQILI